MRDFSLFEANVPDFSLSEESKHVIKGILLNKTTETNGILSIDELGDCLEAFGFNADDEDVEFLQKHFDDNGDGELEVMELINNIDVINWHCFYGKILMKEFSRIDSDGDGIIRYPEFLKVLTTRGPNPLPPPDARRLLDKLARKFDANFDGKFSYSEFVKIYMSDALPYKDTIGEESSSDEEEKQIAATAAAKKDAKKKKKSTMPLKKKATPTNGESLKPTTSKTTAPSASGSSSIPHSRGGASSTKAPTADRKKTPSSTASGKSTTTKPKSAAVKVQRRSTTT